MKTINIEICDNADGDIYQATENAVELCADILKRNGITNVNGYLWQHNHWTGKDCPYDIRRSNPYDWNTFVNKVQAKLNNGGGTIADQVLHKGSKVMFDGIFKVDEIMLPNNTYKNGAVGCYKTCYGNPIGNQDWIPSQCVGNCNPNKSKVDFDGIIDEGDYFVINDIFTVVDIDLPTKYTTNGVAILEKDGIKFRVDCGVLYELQD